MHVCNDSLINMNNISSSISLLHPVGRVDGIFYSKMTDKCII